MLVYGSTKDAGWCVLGLSGEYGLSKDTEVLWLWLGPEQRVWWAWMVSMDPAWMAVDSSDWLGEAGQALHHLGDEREGSGCALRWVLLRQVKQWWRHDGWTQEAQEQWWTDEPVCNILTTSFSTTHTPRCKHFLQLPWKNTVESVRILNENYSTKHTE